jgi:hypothetical protein
MTSRELLLYLRAKQQDVVGYDPARKTCAHPEAWFKLVSAEVDAFLEKDCRLKAEEFGSYQDVLLDRLRMMIEDTSPECRAAHCAVGELFLSYPQAKIMRASSSPSEYLIALHTHLCHFLRCVVTGGMLRIRLDNDLAVNMDRESLYPWFDRVFRFYLLREGTLPAIPAPTDPAELITTELTHVAALLWIICHEYGHYLAGHFQKGRSWTFQIAGTEVETCEGWVADAASWEREHQADRIGVDLLLRAVTHEAFRYGDAGPTPKEDRIGLACWGIDAAVGLLGLVDRRYVLLGKSHYEPCSHPPAHARLAHLREKWPELFSNRLMFASIVTGYFDALYRGLPGSHTLREP